MWGCFLPWLKDASKVIKHTGKQCSPSIKNRNVTGFFRNILAFPDNVSFSAEHFIYMQWKVGMSRIQAKFTQCFGALVFNYMKSLFIVDQLQYSKSFSIKVFKTSRYSFIPKPVISKYGIWTLQTLSKIQILNTTLPYCFIIYTINSFCLFQRAKFKNN